MIDLKADIVTKVLEYYFINPGARHYVRQLASLLKIDPGNLSRKMAELKKEGFFTVEKEGKNHFFSLNHNFPLLEEYRMIYESEYGVVKTIAELLKKIKSLKEAYIFGSYAKGNFEEGSDIDLLVVGSHDHVMLSRKLSVLEKRWHREINVVDYSFKEFQLKKNKEPFLIEIFSGKIIKIV